MSVFGGRLLAHLVVGDRRVADYVDGSDLDATLSPRPFLHPVTTLAGTPVTDAAPEDHRWHLGVSVAVQDAAGVNLWGGRTFVRGDGYTWRDDHGTITHDGWVEHGPSGLVEELTWRRPDGSPLLSERRCLSTRALEGPEPGWALDVDTTLSNPAADAVLLGSPATNGRTGAGYGGLFWRLPRAAGPSAVFTADRSGEEAVHGSRAAWVAYTGDGGAVDATFTLVLGARDDVTAQDPWFVRLTGYPGLCSSLAAEDPLVVAAGGSVTRRLTALVVDRHLTAERVADAWRSASTV